MGFLSAKVVLDLFLEKPKLCHSWATFYIFQGTETQIKEYKF